MRAQYATQIVYCLSWIDTSKRKTVEFLYAPLLNRIVRNLLKLLSPILVCVRFDRQNYTLQPDAHPNKRQCLILDMSKFVLHLRSLINLSRQTISTVLKFQLIKLTTILRTIPLQLEFFSLKSESASFSCCIYIIPSINCNNKKIKCLLSSDSISIYKWNHKWNLRI